LTNFCRLVSASCLFEFRGHQVLQKVDRPPLT
jgi:hypothetical protein